MEGANPWVVRAVHDFLSLAEVEDAQWLVGEVGREVLRLFSERQLAEEFCSLGMSVLRKMLWSRAVPPPGFEEQEAEVRSWMCSGFPAALGAGRRRRMEEGAGLCLATDERCCHMLG